MTLYIHLAGGKPDSAPVPLPSAYLNISGFNRLSRDELARYGWYPYEAVDTGMAAPDGYALHRTLQLEKDGVVRSRAEPISLSSESLQNRLADERRKCLARIKEERQRAEQRAITINGCQIEPSAASLSALKIAADEGEKELWRSENGRFIEMLPEQLEAAYKAVREYRKSCFAREAELESKVRGAGSLDELFAIETDEGWP